MSQEPKGSAARQANVACRCRIVVCGAVGNSMYATEGLCCIEACSVCLQFVAGVIAIFRQKRKSVFGVLKPTHELRLEKVVTAGQGLNSFRPRFDSSCVCSVYGGIVLWGLILSLVGWSPVLSDR